MLSTTGKSSTNEGEKNESTSNDDGDPDDPYPKDYISPKGAGVLSEEEKKKLHEEMIEW